MIISLVANSINILTTILQNVLLLASWTGKIIVSSVTWTSSLIFTTLQTVALFFQIVYEDNISIFTEEIPTSVNGVVNAINSQIDFMQNGISVMYHTTYLKASDCLSAVSWLIRALLVMCGEVLTMLKNTVIFTGDTIWFIITFIPVHLPPLVKATFKFIGNIIINLVVDSYMSLLKFTNYLTEVPIQSLLGIIIAIVLVRLCVHFKEHISTQIHILYWSLIRNISYMYYVIFNYFTNPEIALIPRIVNGEDVGTREANFDSPEGDDSVNPVDSLCVVCQEQQKCVLTLPCRHVCLCADCCRRLYGYQRTCPICRTFIYHSVTVYL